MLSIVIEHKPDICLIDIRMSVMDGLQLSAFAATRVQVPCMETGQAAGLAASVCLLNGGVPVQETPVDKLLEKVHEYGSCIENNP